MNRRALLLALAAGGCAMQDSGLDPKLASDLGYIKIVSSASSEKCRYLGEALSFRMLPSKLGVDVFNVEGGIRDKHDLELRQHAKQLGANVIEVVQSQDTGFAYLVQVNTFHAC
jgi:hypothetical protein